MDSEGCLCPLPACKYKYRVSVHLKAAVADIHSISRNLVSSETASAICQSTNNVAVQYGEVSAESPAAVRRKRLSKRSVSTLSRHLRSYLLIKRREFKTGLSTYYIKLRTITSLYQMMIAMLGAIEAIGFLPGCFVKSESELTGTAGEKRELQANTLTDACKCFGRYMEDLLAPLAHSYSEQHLNLDAAGFS